MTKKHIDKIINIVPLATPEEQEKANEDFEKDYTKTVIYNEETGKETEVIYLQNSIYEELKAAAEKAGLTPGEYLFSVLAERAERAEITPFVNEYNMPFGPYFFALTDAIQHAGTGRKLFLTANNRKLHDRNTEIVVKPYSDNGFTLTQKNKNGKSSITIINKEVVKSTAALKLFVFILAKAAQQNFNPVVFFTLEELVSVGMYSSINNARDGIKNHILALQSIRIAGELKKYKTKKQGGTIKQEGGVLFSYYKLDQNGVKIWLTPAFNIDFYASYFTKLPRWIFSLNSRAFSLSLYIFVRARTARQTNFNISFNQIRERLALPTKEEYDEINKAIKEANKNKPKEDQEPLKKFKPAQYVRKPIIEAIEEIQRNIELNENEDIKISPHYSENEKNLDNWLNDSYLEIEITGDLLKQIKDTKRKQSAIIAKNAEKKKEGKEKNQT